MPDLTSTAALHAEHVTRLPADPPAAKTDHGFKKSHDPDESRGPLSAVSDWQPAAAVAFNYPSIHSL